MKTKLLTLLVVLGLGLVVTSIASAKEEYKHKGERKDRSWVYGRGGSMRGLDLTDDQKTEVQKIMKAAHEEAGKVDPPKKKREIMKAAFEKIKTTVLTEEQRKKLEERKGGKHGGMWGDRMGRWGGPMRGLDLTDDQKTKVHEIMKAAHEEAGKVDPPKKKREIMKAAFEKIKTTVLTEEQRKKLEERKGKGHGGLRGSGAKAGTETDVE